ncbi:MAG: tRNA 2-thiouridine(34) synthase MnmA, partial [Phycisphaerae bacterium]|nr:tRNA 2-thiouridine(34) synthase MnmA [Phycisphaerae bacterium]
RAAGGTELRRGLDHAKDQSYVLFGLGRDRLDRVLLPIGEMHKPDVRRLAQDLSLPVFDKPDSQEICFVPDNDYAAFVERRRPELASASGDILDESGNPVGVHAGQHRFTIGQRRGVGMALGHPVYVVAKDPAARTVTIGPAERLLASRCTALEANWLADPPPAGDWFACWARYRSNGAPVPARARAVDPAVAEGPNYSGRQHAFEVEFDRPQSAVAPGQAVVLYADDETDRVLGGGWIARVG